MVAEPSAPPLPPGRTLHLPGRGTTFVREVAGPPGAPTVLLLHGWLATSDLNWFSTYEPLGRHFRVVALDHRGHGRGVRSRRPFRLEHAADDAAAVCRVLQLDRPIAVGYSMGGAVAQLLWRRHPRLVAGLVLCSTTPRFSGQSPGSCAFFSSLLGLSIVARLTPEPLLRQVSANVIRHRARSVDSWVLSELERGHTPSRLQAGWALGRFDSRRWLGAVDVPAAVVLTTRDQVVLPDRQRSLARAIAGATVHPVDSGHAACMTDPELFAPALVEACTSVAERAGLLPPHAEAPAAAQA